MLLSNRWPEIVARRAAPLLLALLAITTGCGGRADAAAGAQADSAVALTDDAGRMVQLPRPARRVISLLPAGTETLFAIGAGEQVVGRTRYDSDPAYAHLPSVGGGLDPSLEALVALEPDLVVAFETAGESKLRAQLERLGIPVYAIATQDTSDIFRNVAHLGRLTGHAGEAETLLAQLRGELDEVRASVEGLPRPRVLYVVGVDPAMTAGPGSFIIQLLGVAGGETVFPEASVPWPQVSLEEVVKREPDVVMLPHGEDPNASLERLRAAPGWRELRAVREGRVVSVPADLMNRPGPGIGEAARRMRDALHGGVK